MCQVWNLVMQMMTDAVVDDAAKVAAIRADAQFKNASLLLDALAEADSQLADFASFW